MAGGYFKSWHKLSSISNQLLLKSGFEAGHGFLSRFEANHTFEEVRKGKKIAQQNWKNLNPVCVIEDIVPLTSWAGSDPHFTGTPQFWSRSPAPPTALAGEQLALPLTPRWVPGLRELPAPSGAPWHKEQ